MDLKLPALLIAFLLFGTITLDEQSFFPSEHKSLTILGINGELALKESLVTIAENESLHYYRFRINNTRTIAYSSSITSKTIESTLKNVENLQFYALTTSECSIDRTSGASPCTETFEETALSSISLGAKNVGEYLLSLTAPPFKTGLFNLTLGFSTGSITSKFDPQISACDRKNTFSTTTYLIGGKNLTYSTCVPTGSDYYVMCDGYVSGRTNATTIKTITVKKKGATEKDFQNCQVYEVPTWENIISQRTTGVAG